MHLIADLPLQSAWMAENKGKRWPWHNDMGWFARHPAAYVHAGIHGVLLAVVFGWVAVPLAISHLLIDTKVPIVWWQKMMRQTLPGSWSITSHELQYTLPIPNALLDMGMAVRMVVDQTFHFTCIAIAAILVTL